MSNKLSGFQITLMIVLLSAFLMFGLSRVYKACGPTSEQTSYIEENET